MAAMANLPPPPGASQPTPGDAPPSMPQATSAPAQPSPAMQQGTQQVISVLQGLRAIAKAYPSTSAKIAEINDMMREVGLEIMKGQQMPEPQAPPIGG